MFASNVEQWSVKGVLTHGLTI